MAKRLQVRLLPSWRQADNPDGPVTFHREGGTGSALQFSIYAEYKSGEVPNPSAEQLIDLARGHGERHNAGALVECLSGECDLGSYGSAVFTSAAYPRVQFWYLSNGRDFVLATHVCSADPTAEDVAEAQQIVSALGLAPDDIG